MFAVFVRIRNRTRRCQSMESFESVSVDQSNGLFGRTNSWSRRIIYIEMLDACNFIETVSDRIVLDRIVQYWCERDSSIAFWYVYRHSFASAAKEMKISPIHFDGKQPSSYDWCLLPLFVRSKKEERIQTKRCTESNLYIYESVSQSQLKEKRWFLCSFLFPQSLPSLNFKLPRVFHCTIFGQVMCKNRTIFFSVVAEQEGRVKLQSDTVISVQVNSHDFKVRRSEMLASVMDRIRKLNVIMSSSLMKIVDNNKTQDRLEKKNNQFHSQQEEWNKKKTTTKAMIPDNRNVYRYSHASLSLYTLFTLLLRHERKSFLNCFHSTPINMI